MPLEPVLFHRTTAVRCCYCKGTCIRAPAGDAPARWHRCRRRLVLAPVRSGRLVTCRVYGSAAFFRHFHLLPFVEGLSPVTFEREGMGYVTFLDYETAWQGSPYVDTHGCETGRYVLQVEIVSAEG